MGNMRKTAITQEDAGQLCKWYSVNKRPLPWRDTGDPYHVWISEIMLQQTRIEAVRNKYVQFISELPDISSLAGCDEDRLMRLWEGLGYYSRARSLKKCAGILMEDYNGRLPADYNALLKLPGIGPYTAGAIASIAFHLPYPAVDGNVLRILARISGCRDDIREEKTKQELTGMITDVYKADIDPALFNQGLMELGQTVCLPNGSPRCQQCVWSVNCTAARENTTGSIPFRSSLKQRKIRERTVLVIRDGSSFLLRKRPAEGLLAGLYEFPGYDGHLSRKEALHEAEKLSLAPLTVKALPDAKHVFTHLEWHMKAYEITVAEITSVPDGNYILAKKKELAGLAVPSAFRTYTDWYSLRDQDS